MRYDPHSRPVTRENVLGLLAHVWHSLFSTWWTNTRSDYFFIIGSYIRLMKTRALHIFRHDYLMCLLWTQNFRFQFPESKQMILQEM